MNNAMESVVNNAINSVVNKTSESRYDIAGEAISDETAFAQCVANAQDHKGEPFSEGGFMETPNNVANHWFQLAILKCAQDNQ